MPASIDRTASSPTQGCSPTGSDGAVPEAAATGAGLRAADAKGMSGGGACLRPISRPTIGIDSNH